MRSSSLSSQENNGKEGFKPLGATGNKGGGALGKNRNLGQSLLGIGTEAEVKGCQKSGTILLAASFE